MRSGSRQAHHRDHPSASRDSSESPGGRVQSGLDWMTDVLWFDVVQGKSDRRAPGERLRCGLANIFWDLGPTRPDHYDSITSSGDSTRWIHFPEAT